MRRTIHNFVEEKTFPTGDKLKSKLEEVTANFPKMSLKNFGKKYIV